MMWNTCSLPWLYDYVCCSCDVINMMGSKLHDEDAEDGDYFVFRCHVSCNREQLWLSYFGYFTYLLTK